VYWTFVECVEGMSEACKALNTPVTGGNVSFYNENPESAVYPTPTVGMVGLLEDASKVITSGFKTEGDVIMLLGETRDEIGGSEYLKVVHGKVAGKPPDLNTERERALQNCVLEAAHLCLLNSAHDCAEGGLAVALAEGCIINEEKPLGAKIEYECGLRTDRLLFSETQSRIIVSLDPSNAEKLSSLAQKHHVPVETLGTVGGEWLEINQDIRLDVFAMKEAYYTSIRKIMES
jgi:phosphoribosylformylglycinamidine synthase